MLICSSLLALLFTSFIFLYRIQSQFFCLYLYFIFYFYFYFLANIISYKSKGNHELDLQYVLIEITWISVNPLLTVQLMKLYGTWTSRQHWHIGGFHPPTLWGATWADYFALFLCGSKRGCISFSCYWCSLFTTYVAWQILFTALNLSKIFEGRY